MLAGLSGALAASNLFNPYMVKTVAGLVAGNDQALATASLLVDGRSESRLVSQSNSSDETAMVSASTPDQQALPPHNQSGGVDGSAEPVLVIPLAPDPVPEDSETPSLRSAATALGETDAASRQGNNSRDMIPPVKTQQELFRSFQSYLESTGNAEITDHQTQEELFRKFIRWSVESPPAN